MTYRINILTSDDTYDRLWAQAHSKRKMVKIKTEELLHLLIDYSVLLGAISNSSSFTITEPPRRTRPRLKPNGDEYA